MKWSEGIVTNKKFGFTMKYRRYNRKNVPDDVEYLASNREDAESGGSSNEPSGATTRAAVQEGTEKKPYEAQTHT